MSKEYNKIINTNSGGLPVDRGPYIESKTYSFFPDQSEAEFFTRASVEDLEKVYAHQPDMAARFTHELWRQGRTNEITELGRRGSVPDLTQKAPDVDSFKKSLLYLHDIVTSSSMMIHWGNVDPGEFGQFVIDTMVLARMGSKGVQKPERLDVQDKQELLTGVKAVGTLVQSTIKKVQISELMSDMATKALSSD